VSHQVRGQLTRTSQLVEDPPARRSTDEELLWASACRNGDWSTRTALTTEVEEEVLTSAASFVT
jgi:hypothetical protein